MRLAGAGVVLLVFVTSVARAGNDDAVLLGNQATLTGGAITAVVSDGSGAWFNPAGLGHSTRNQLDVTGSVYGMNLYDAKSLLVLPDGTSADAKVTDWMLVPSVLSYARELLDDEIVIAFGIFVPRTNDYELQTVATTVGGQTFAATLTTVFNETDYALTVAKRFGSELRVGATLAGVYTSRREFVQVAAGTPGAADEDFYNGSAYATQADYGLRLTLGTQWSPVPELAFGVSIQSPMFTGFSDVKRLVGQGAATMGMTAFELEAQQGTVAVWDFTTPARLRAGVAYRIGKTQLLLDGDVSTPISLPRELPDSTFYDRTWVGNGRVGMTHDVIPGLTAGGGLFTDLSGRKQYKTHFVGVAFGVELESQHTADEKKRELTFSTTLGGRYAYGWGDLPGVALSLNGAELQQRPIASPVTVHELAFNLGGGVDF